MKKAGKKAVVKRVAMWLEANEDGKVIAADLEVTFRGIVEYDVDRLKRAMQAAKAERDNY